MRSGGEGRFRAREQHPKPLILPSRARRYTPESALSRLGPAVVGHEGVRVAREEHPTHEGEPVLGQAATLRGGGATRFQRDFNRSLPATNPTETLGCAERAAES